MMKMHLSETYFLAEKPLKWAILLKIKRLNRLYAHDKNAVFRHYESFFQNDAESVIAQ